MQPATVRLKVRRRRAAQAALLARRGRGARRGPDAARSGLDHPVLDRCLPSNRPLPRGLHGGRHLVDVRHAVELARAQHRRARRPRRLRAQRRRCPLTGLGRLRRVRPLIPHIHAPHHSPTTPICKSNALIIPTAGESPGSGLPGESLVLCVRSTTNLAILVMTEVVSYRRLASRTTVLL